MLGAGARHPDADGEERLYTALNEYLLLEGKFQPRLCLPAEENGEVTAGARDGAAHVMRCLKVWFDLPADVLINAINLFDRFLTKMKVRPCHVPCITVSCVNIAVEEYAAETKGPRSVSIEELVSISQSACTAGDVSRMSRVIVDKLGLIPGAPRVTPLHWLRLLRELLARALHGEVDLPPCCQPSELESLLEIVICDSQCANARTCELALVLLYHKLEQKLVEWSHSADAPEHAYYIYEFARQLQQHCHMCDASLLAVRNRVRDVITQYEARGKQPQKQRLVWRLSERTLKVLRPTDRLTSLLPTIEEQQHLAETTPRKNRAGSESSENEETCDWPRSPLLPVYLSISQSACTAGDVSRMSRVIVDKLGLIPGAPRVTPLHWLRLLRELLARALHGEIDLPPCCQPSELESLLEIVICDAQCANARTCELALVLLYHKLELKLVEWSHSADAPEHAYYIYEFARQLQQHCHMCDASLLAVRNRVRDVITQYEARGKQPQKQRLVWRLSERTLKVLRPTDRLTSLLPTIEEQQHLAETTPRKNRAGSESSENEETCDWPRSPLLPVYLSISQSACTAGDVSRMSRVIVDKLGLIPGAPRVTPLHWLRLLRELLARALHGEIDLPPCCQPSELESLLEIVICDAQCANARTCELALVLLYHKLEQKLVEWSHSADAPEHAYYIYEFARQLQQHCHMCDASLLAVRNRVRDVITQYEARGKQPQKQRLVWRLSERTLKVLRPTDRLTSLLPTIEEQQHLAETTPRKNRAGSESSENEETCDWPRSPLLPVYLSISQSACTAGDVSRMSRVIVDKLGLIPGAPRVTPLHWLRLLRELLARALHGEIDLPPCCQPSELESLLEIVICDAQCANARTCELALVLLYHKLEQKLVEWSHSADAPEHAYYIYEFARQLQQHCHMCDASLLAVRNRVRDVITQYEARGKQPQKQRLVWRLSERTLKVLRPTDRLTSLLPTIEEQQHLAETTPRKNRAGSESSENEETCDWPRSPLLPVYCDN